MPSVTDISGLLSSGDFRLAEEGARALVGQDPEGAEGWSLLGMALLAQDRPSEARDAFEAAHALGDASLGTRVNLAIAAQTAGDLSAAEMIYREVSAVVPGWAPPRHRLGEILLARGEIDEAVTQFRSAIAGDPSHVASLWQLASLGSGTINDSDLADLAHSSLRSAPGSPIPHLVLAQIKRRGGELDGALDHHHRAWLLVPADTTVALLWARCATEGGAAGTSVLLGREMSASFPHLTAPHLALAALFEALGQLTSALDCYDATLALDPASSHARIGRAITLAILQTADAEAERELRALITDGLGGVTVQNALGGLLFRLHRHAEARSLLEIALGEHPDQADLWAQMGLVLSSLGRQDEGVSALSRARELAPHDPQIARSLVTSLPYSPRADGLATLAAGMHASSLLSRHGATAQVRAPAVAGARLKVGLLSSSFRVHPVSWLTIAGLETLDTERFALTCYATRRGDDFMTNRFRARADLWRDCSEMRDEDVTAIMREDGLHVLIDLGGWGEGGRPGVVALRGAPVQIKWVGAQAASTGIPEMDWMISDRWETPDGFEPFYSERLLRLQDGYVCYAPPAYAPPVGDLPALSRGGVTFGCLNNLAKITPDVIAVWSAILSRVPGSRLLLKTHQFSEVENRRRLLEAFGEHGVEPARIFTEGRSAHAEFLGRYGEVDIALDPFPYSGGLTTVEALWMGVPTLTWPGETFASRHSASHMSNAGYKDWVLPSLADYIEAAVSRAGDLTYLARLRSDMRRRTAESPLCDAPRFGRGLGDAIQRAYEET